MQKMFGCTLSDYFTTICSFFEFSQYSVGLIILKYRCRAVSFVSVEAKLSFVEPGHTWAQSPSPSKAPGISYQRTMKTSVRMLKTSGGL